EANAAVMFKNATSDRTENSWQCASIPRDKVPEKKTSTREKLYCTSETHWVSRAVASRPMSEASHSTHEYEAPGVALLCCFTVIVVQQSTKPLPPLDR